MLDIQEIEAEKTMNWKHKTNNASPKGKGQKKTRWWTKYYTEN
jgi:hypothetical protein